MRTAPRHELVLLALLALYAPLLAAGIQKWTDANGNVHYGDAPPPGANTQSVRVNAPPPSRNPAPVYAPVPAPAQTPANPRSVADERQARIDEANRRNRDGISAMAASYCNDGADAIRQKNYDRELMQQAAQQGAALEQGRVIPPAQRIQPTAPCQWPQTCTSRK